MASTAPHGLSINPDTLITIKVTIDGSNRRFKLPLRDLGAHVFPNKLRHLLAIPPEATVVFERYSDSATAFVLLDSENTAVYKQLYRAAKAKLKLRIKATVTQPLEPQLPVGSSDLRAEHLPPKMSPLHAPLEPLATVPEVLLPAVSTTTLVNPPQEDPNNTAQVNNDLPSLPGRFPDTGLPTCLLPRQTSTRSPTGFPRYTQKPVIPINDFPVGSFCIDCNNCNLSIPNIHYHCSICDDGDFDLCQACVDSGVLCEGEGHWLIKRFIHEGKVINSTTEIIESRSTKETKTDLSTEEIELAVPTEEEQKPVSFTRTCNACVGVFDDSAFVTCLDCEDYDLCVSCHLRLEHGHHPGHTFKPLTEDASFGELVLDLCSAGRGAQHLAICDGCDKRIVGVRHKCLNCPDWDYCSSCVQSAKHIHPSHRFAPIYEPLMEVSAARPQVHYGIYCDGPLCKSKGDRCYIVGERYKCAVCHDTDFCANCEALPTNRHNRTHPLIKFRTPVRNVSVTTLGEKANGERMMQMGDRQPAPLTKSAATETTPAAMSANAATQVQTVAEVEPVDESAVEPPKENPQAATVTPIADLQAFFIRDTVADSSKIDPDTTFEQTWTLSNPGPRSWPAGCSVRFIGGDSMLNVDTTRPSSVSALADATESNVIGREVKPGELIDFRVTMKAPEREGKAISYWRLKTADGVPFGHKLWCDIDVVKPEPVDIKLEPESEVTRAEDVKVEEEAHETSQESEEQSESTMIFPKLDKESPMSSTHEASTEPTIIEPASTVEQDLLEDIESLELQDEETDDGFLTDEEYDILDASDEEGYTTVPKPARK